MKQLEAENAPLQRKLQRADTIITLQEKVAEILGIPPKKNPPSTAAGAPFWRRPCAGGVLGYTV